jgi:DNA-binding beta-propeller fold protein YncE
LSFFVRPSLGKRWRTEARYTLGEVHSLTRPLLILCAGLNAVPLAIAANSTIYTPAPNATITTISATTFQAEGHIAAAGNAGTFLLSADGTTFYVLEMGSTSSLGSVRAIDRATGKNIHTYKTQHPIWGGLAVLPNQSEVYVGTCSQFFYGACIGGNVEVLDAASGLNLAVISMGGDQVFQIAAAANGATVYALHYNNTPCLVSCEIRPGISANGTPGAVPSGTVPSGTLTAIDAASLQVGASFAPPQYFTPQSFVLASDNQHGYVFTSEQDVATGGIYQVDLTQMTLEATIAGDFGNIGTIALSANGATLAVLQNGYQDQLIFVDTATASATQVINNIAGSLISVGSDGNAYILSNGEYIEAVNAQTGSITSVLAGRAISAAILSSKSGEFYLLCPGGSTAEVVPEGSTTVSKVFSIGGPPMWLALSPDGGTLYSAGWDGGVWAVSTATGQVTAKMLPDVAFIGAMAVSPNGETLYASAIQPNTLFFVNASTGAVEKSVALPACTNYVEGGAIAVSPKGDHVITSQCGTVAVIDTTAQTIVGQIAGANGIALAASPKGDVFYVSVGGRYSPPSEIDVVDMATNSVTGTIPLSASAIAFSPDGAAAYVVGVQNNVSGVAVIDTSTLVVTAFIPSINPLGWCAVDGCEGAGEGIAVTPDGNFIYAGGAPGALIDAQTLAVVGPFTSGGPIVIH